MNTTGTRLLPALVGLVLLLSGTRTALAQGQGPFELPADHFLCYTARTTRGDLAIPSNLEVTLTDQFETGTVHEVRRPLGICNPASKNAEGIVDPFTHLTAYRIRTRPGAPRHVPVENVRVFNQLGDFRLTTTREDRLLLPAAKDAAGGPVTAPANDAHDVDHYKCYRVRRARGASAFPRGLQVSLRDQFDGTARLFDIRRPRLLCNPVDKNGEGTKNLDGHLTCFRARPAAGAPPHTPRAGISTADQFVVHTMNTRREELLCVPSLKNPPAEFCGDGLVNQPPFEACDGDASACQPGETCTALCECLAALGQRTFSLDPVNSALFTSFLGPIPVASPTGTLVLDGGAFGAGNVAPVTLANAPAYVTVELNLGDPQTICYQLLSCSGTVHCGGGANVDALAALDSLASSELGCIRDGTKSCADVPANVCCSNSCEGGLVGSGNLPAVSTGVGAGDSGPGALLMTCSFRQLQSLPLGGIDCSIQNYAGQPVQTAALTTGTATSKVLQHCAGPFTPPTVVPTFAVTGTNVDCATFTTENGPGTIVWALPTEEPTTIIAGDGANAFILVD